MITRWIERAFRAVFRRTALRGSGVVGSGFVESRATGERRAFWIRGDVSDTLLGEAMSKVARQLYGPLAGGPFSRMRGAVTHPTTVRNALADLVVDRIDAGAGAGTLEIQTSGDAEIATLTFGDPAFGAASSGTATANAITSDTSATGGTAAKARAYDSNDVEVFACAVGTSGSDINRSSLAIGAADTVSMSSLTYTAPA
jgi:hypothetical protein